jgi:hypothetical protein
LVSDYYHFYYSIRGPAGGKGSQTSGPAAAAAKASAVAGGKGSQNFHIHSSSKRKSSQNMPKIIKKSSFSKGFRSYVRHFRGAI